jgi:hypothetical protein
VRDSSIHRVSINNREHDAINKRGHAHDFLDTFRRARIAFHKGGDFPKLFPSQVVTPAEPPSPRLN